jgi:hypothetical protein
MSKKRVRALLSEYFLELRKEEPALRKVQHNLFIF